MDISKLFLLFSFVKSEHSLNDILDKPISFNAIGLTDLSSMTVTVDLGKSSLYRCPRTDTIRMFVPYIMFNMIFEG